MQRTRRAASSLNWNAKPGSSGDDRSSEVEVRCLILSGSPSTLPELQIFCPIPIRSLTADEIRCEPPRDGSVVCTAMWLGGSCICSNSPPAAGHNRARLPGATHTAEDAAVGDCSGLHPFVQETTYPVRHGKGSNMTSISAQVNDGPMPFTLLKVADRQVSETCGDAGRRRAVQRAAPCPVCA